MPPMEQYCSDFRTPTRIIRDAWTEFHETLPDAVGLYRYFASIKFTCYFFSLSVPHKGSGDKNARDFGHFPRHHCQLTRLLQVCFV